MGEGERNTEQQPDGERDRGERTGAGVRGRGPAPVQHATRTRPRLPLDAGSESSGRARVRPAEQPAVPMRIHRLLIRRVAVFDPPSPTVLVHEWFGWFGRGHDRSYPDPLGTHQPDPRMGGYWGLGFGSLVDDD